MNDAIFSNLWGEALTSTDRDAYVSDWSLSSIWVDSSEECIPQERIDYLNQLWDAAHMSVKDICKVANLSQTNLATRFCIPRRTVEDWCRGISKCADYIRLMMILNLGILTR